MGDAATCPVGDQTRNLLGECVRHVARQPLQKREHKKSIMARVASACSLTAHMYLSCATSQLCKAWTPHARGFAQHHFSKDGATRRHAVTRCVERSGGVALYTGTERAGKSRQTAAVRHQCNWTGQLHNLQGSRGTARQWTMAAYLTSTGADEFSHGESLWRVFCCCIVELRQFIRLSETTCGLRYGDVSLL